MKKSTQIVCSCLILAIAIPCGVVFHLFRIPPGISIHLKDPSRPSVFSPRKLSQEELLSYRRDGVVFVPGLLKQEEAQTLRATSIVASNQMFNAFDFLGSKNYAKLSFDLWRIDETIASLSLAALPQVAADIMSQYSNNDNTESSFSFRLLREAFFNYASGGAACGWHVDDVGFWPTHNDTSGLTIWVALDTFRVADGGGLAAVNMTKVREAYNNNKETVPSIEFCRTEQTIKGTCVWAEQTPFCLELFENAKLQWDMEPGDAILWDRWTFHKGVPSVLASTDDDDNKNGIIEKRRYSVRYIPETARAVGLVHASVEQGSPFQSPYYPQVWPDLLDDELKALENGLEGDINAGTAFRFFKIGLKRKLNELIYSSNTN